MLIMIRKFRYMQKSLVLALIVAVMAFSFASLIFLWKTDSDKAARSVDSFQNTHDKISSVLFVFEDQINSLFHQLSLDGNLNEWLLQRDSGTHNMYMLREIQQNFLSIIHSDPLIASIYLYSRSNNTVLSTNYQFSSLQQFPDGAVFTGLQDKNFIWVEQRTENKVGYGSNPHKIITFVGRLGSWGIVAINVDVQKLFMETPEKHGIVLVDQEHGIIASRTNASVPAQLKPLSQLPVTTEKPIMYGEDYAFVSSHHPGEWKVVSFTPQIDNYAAWMLRRYLMLVALVSLVLCGVLLYWFVRKMYFKPMRRYRSNFDKNLEDLKHNFILDILTGKLKQADIRGKAGEMGICFDSNRFMVIVFQIDDYYRYLLGKGQEDRFFTGKTIYNAIKWTFMTTYPAHIVKAEFEKIAILIAVPNHEDEGAIGRRVAGTIKYLQNEIKNSCSLTVCAGISDTVQAIEHVPSAYYHALHALGFKAIYGKHTIICYKDVPKNTDNVYPVQAMAIADLHELLKEGSVDKLEQEINRVLDEIMTDEHFSFDLINAAFSNILFGIVKLTLELRYDMANIVQENMFMKLYSCEFVQDKKQYVISVAKTVADYIQRRKSSHNKTFHLILNYIHQRYDQPISLTTMSDSLGINSSYISTLIKNELGCGFVDYLNQLRIKKALRLLEDKSMPVNKVSEACGYDTVHSFIRNFKKIHFFTPTEYRSKIAPKM